VYEESETGKIKILNRWRVLGIHACQKEVVARTHCFRACPSGVVYRPDRRLGDRPIHLYSFLSDHRDIQTQDRSCCAVSRSIVDADDRSESPGQR
jgi:hypothetical protein